MNEQLKFFKGKETSLGNINPQAGSIYHCEDTGNTYLANENSELEIYSNTFTFSDAEADSIIPVNADTLNGKTADDFMTPIQVDDAINEAVENVAYVNNLTNDTSLILADAESLGGLPAENYATKNYVVDTINQAQVVNGMSATLRILLQTILGAGVYTSDQSANIELLNTILANQSAESYAITNNLVFVESNNSENSVVCGNAYIASLTVLDGYELESVTVTMSGVDITATAYDGNGNIKIDAVTGNIVISATGIIPQIIIDEIRLGANFVKMNTGFTIQSNSGGTSRALLLPSGQYTKKGITYQFSIGDSTNFYYSAPFFKINENDISFDFVEGQNVVYPCDYEQVCSTGWTNADKEYTVQDDNVMLLVNFKKTNDGGITKSEIETLMNNFTIKAVIK